MISMLRLFVLSTYLLTILAGQSSPSVLCFHPDHGLRVEANHAKSGCAAGRSNDLPGIQQANTSCVDIPLIQRASITRNTLSINTLLIYTIIPLSSLAIVCIPYLDSNSSIAYSSNLSSISPHIFSTILRI